MIEQHHQRRWRGVAITLVFWCYTVAWFLIVRHLSHAYLSGWPARVGTIAGIALGLSLWGRWLQPRIVWCLGAMGYWLFVLCYLGLLAPFALVAKRLAPARRSPGLLGCSSWVPRRPMLQTLDDGRQES